MPAKKTKTVKAKKSTRRTPAVEPMPVLAEEAPKPKCSCSKTSMLLIGLTILFILALAFSKGYILAAIVNNKPIFRFQMNQIMMARFGKQTLEGMISEQLITDEAKRQRVSVSPEEIKKQEQEVLKSFGGKVTLDELLSFQGMTKAEFENQIRLQLTVNKLMEQNVSVSNEEVAAYIETNRSSLTATDEAGLSNEARKALTEQKVNEKIQPWFTQLKNNAKIFKFL